MVGTAVGDVARMIKPGVTGWLAQPKVREDLIENIVAAFRYPGDRALRAAHAKQLLESEYSVAVQAQSWDRLLAPTRL